MTEEDEDGPASGPGGKAPDAFRTISEVADELGLPQHVLRFWETRFGQIRPMKRGGGRRYYRPQDVELLRGIKHLLYDHGYTIKGVQRLLREHGLRFVAAAASDKAAAARGGTADAGRDEEDMVDVPQADAPHQRHAEPRPEAEDDEIPSWHRPAGEGGRPLGLGADDRHLLQATLVELLDLKRLLDQAR